MPSVGEQYGDYKLQEELKPGGFGRVFVARHVEHPWRLVAIKFIREELVDPVTVRRFLREYRIQANISHPNVVKVIELLSHDEERADAIVMEYVRDAVPLNEAMTVSTSDNRIASLLLQALYGLAEVHSAVKEPVHRDVSPGNLLVEGRGDGLLKIADFGLAREVIRVSSILTLRVPHASFGTPGCTAPEQLDDPADADCRSDIYSLGKTFAACVQGRDPQHADVALLGEPWQSFLGTMSDYDPENRFPDAPASIDRLLNTLADHDITPSDLGFHARQLTDYLSRDSCVRLVSHVLDKESLTKDHLDFSFRIGLSGLIRATDPGALFDRLDAGPVEEEFADGRAEFSRCDPLADLYAGLYPYLNKDRKLALFRRLLDVGAEHNRFHVMATVRNLRAQEQNESIRKEQLRIYQSDPVMYDNVRFPE